MSKVCTSCAKVNTLTSKFCVSCGNSLGSNATTSSSTTTTSTSSKSTLKLAPVISTPPPSSTSNTNGSGSKPLPTPPPSSTTTSTVHSRSTLRIAKTTPSTTTTTTTSTSTTAPRSFSVSYKSPPSLTSTTSSTSTTTTPMPSRSTLKPASSTTTTKTAPTPKSTPTTTTKSQESFLNIKLKETNISSGSTADSVVNRPKSHTISTGSGVDSKPTITPGGSFVKNAIKSRDVLDSKVQAESKIINGEVVHSNSKPSSTNGHGIHLTSPKSLTMGAQKEKPKETTVVVHKKSISAPAPPPPPSSASNHHHHHHHGPTPPELPKKPPHLVSQHSMDNLQKLEKEKFDREKVEREKAELEKQRLERERDERDREKLRQIERERKEKVEKERQKMQMEKDEREKERLAEKERMKAERQAQKEREREEKGIKAKQDKEEREKEKQAEREKRQQEKERRQQEKLLEFEAAEREKQQQEYSIRLSGSNNSIDTSITQSGSHSSSSLNHSNVSDEESEIPSSPKLSFSDVRNKDLEKKKKEREKYNTSPAHGRSRFFSFILGDKDKEFNPDDLVISSPSDRPSTPPVTFSAAGGDDVNLSGDEGSANGDQPPQLRKWAIRKNEHQKSEKDLLASSATMAPSSPSAQSVLIATNRISQIYEENNEKNGSHSGSNSPSTSSSNVPISHSNSPSQSSFVLGSSRLSSPLTPPDLPNLPPATDQRSRVIEEFIVTEADYIRDLEIMVWLRKELVHQDEQSKVSTMDEINALFSNVEQLILVNKMLYVEFCKPPADTNDFGEAIAIALASMSDFLKSYFVYCTNQTKALSTFTNLRGKNCSYLGYLLSRRECRSLPFDSFLIKPIQRACKYPLLIRELIKSTPENHRSYPMLKTAQSKIESIVATINEKKREFDGQMRMYEIQSRFVEGDIDAEKTIIAPSRKLAKEGIIDSMGFFIPGNTSTQYYKKAKEGCYFLFNDLFIWGTPSKSGGIMTDVPSASDTNCSLKLRAYIPLVDSVIREVPTDTSAFEIIYANKEVWMFVCADEDARIALFNEIEQLQYKKFVEQKEKEDLENQKNKVPIFEDWKLLVRNKPLPEVPKLPSLPPLPDLASSSSSLSTE